MQNNAYSPEFQAYLFDLQQRLEVKRQARRIRLQKNNETYSAWHGSASFGLMFDSAEMETLTDVIGQLLAEKSDGNLQTIYNKLIQFNKNGGNN